MLYLYLIPLTLVIILYYCTGPTEKETALERMREEIKNLKK